MYLGTSSEFNTAVRKDGRTFRARLICGEECIESGFTSIGIYGGSNNADTITIGSTISQRIEVEMQETDIALSGKEWLLEIGLLTGGIIPSDNLYPSDDLLPGMSFYEYVPVGYFTPEKPSTDNGKTTFKAYDRMIKLSVMYTCFLDTVTTLTVLNDISQITGVPIDISDLEEIPIKKPVGYTCREVLMYIAQLYGKFANVSRKGVIAFHWWTQVEDYNITADDTNGFKHDETEFVLGYVYMASAEDDDAVSFTAGDGKQGISVYNPFVTEGIVEKIYADIGGFTYTASKVSFMKADIRLDPWDVVSVTDNKGNNYNVPIMSLEFKYDGGLSATFSAVGNSETEEEIDFKGPMKLLQERMESKVVDAAKKLQSQITQNADSISAEVKRAIDSEVEMAAAIKVNAEGIKQKVSKGELSSEISQEAGLINIKGNRIAIESDYFKMNEDGSINAKKGTFEGEIISDNPSTPYSTKIKDGNISFYGSENGSPFATGAIGSFRKSSESDLDGFSLVLENSADAMSFGVRNAGSTTFKIYYYINNGYNSSLLNYGYRHVFTGDEVHYGFMLGGDATFELLTANSGLEVFGTKKRIVNTASYNVRSLYCYEMPSPIFGDVGHGVIGEDGLCYVDIDQIFFETIDTAQSYHVFLQSYSEHQVYVREKQQGYFIVKGIPGTEFDWEMKAKQFDFPLERLEEKIKEDDYQETDYVAAASEYLEKYKKELLEYE